jgi:copper chaperone CopZ
MTKKVTIEGMTCEHCAMHVKEALEGISGVKSAKVNLTGKFATVEAENSIDDTVIKSAIEDAGYEAVKIE